MLMDCILWKPLSYSWLIHFEKEPNPFMLSQHHLVQVSTTHTRFHTPMWQKRKIPLLVTPIPTPTLSLKRAIKYFKMNSRCVTFKDYKCSSLVEGDMRSTINIDHLEGVYGTRRGQLRFVTLNIAIGIRYASIDMVLIRCTDNIIVNPNKLLHNLYGLDKLLQCTSTLQFVRTVSLFHPQHESLWFRFL